MSKRKPVNDDHPRRGYARSTGELLGDIGGAACKKSGGTLTLLVEGAHAPLIQHLGPMIIERVNRFFGYEAICKVAFRQGRVPAAAPKRSRPQPAPVPKELGEGLRAVADPEL